MSTLVSIFTSRKVLLALFAIVQAVILKYAHVPDAVWMATAGIVGLLIAYIAVDDAARKIDPLQTVREKFARMVGSSAFWLALSGYVVNIVAFYVQLPADMWQLINAALVTVISAAIVEAAGQRVGVK